MHKLQEAETLIGEAGDYARLICLAMADEANACDANKQAVSRAALRIEALAQRALHLLDEQRQSGTGVAPIQSVRLGNPG